MKIRSVCALVLLGLCLQACSTDSATNNADTAGQDMANGDATLDAVGPDSALDVPQSDLALPDVPVADAADALEETSPPQDLLDVEDLSDTLGPDGTDSTDVTECLPVDCALWCPLGFANDEDGCPTCACAACVEDSQCLDVLPECASPFCVGDYNCGCGCDGLPGTTLTCADGQTVPVCSCTPLGYACIPDAHLQCGEFCKPGDNWLVPCGDLEVDEQLCTCEAPACKPQCADDGQNGWLDSCTGQQVAAGMCAGCEAYCGGYGTQDEGWYDGCTNLLLQKTKCATQVECVPGGVGCKDYTCPMGQQTIFTCPDSSEVTMCECKATCKPECKNIGTAEEGLYDPCTGQVKVPGKCANCEVTCDLIGSKSEGWYSSCTGLIDWTQCSIGTWECLGDAYSLCTANSPCAQEGEFITNSVSDFGLCCPGLTLVDDGGFPPSGQCGPSEQWGTGYCVFCGDGICGDHEATCNCPLDCPAEPVDCDPVMQTGCVADQQCHLVDWQPTCGPKGTAGISDGCDQNTHCAPGLACGVAGLCHPACTNDEQCLNHPDFYEFCLKKNGNEYGHCFVYL